MERCGDPPTRPSRCTAGCFLSVHCLVVRYKCNDHIYFLCLCASVTSSIKRSSLPVKGSRPGKNVQLTEGEIRGLCLKSREIFLSQPILLELEAPLKICGESEGTGRPQRGWIYTTRCRCPTSSFFPVKCHRSDL